MKKWMDQGDPPKEISTVEKMNGQPQLLSPNKIAHYFNKWKIPSNVSKKYILLLQERDTSNRSSLTL